MESPNPEKLSSGPEGKIEAIELPPAQKRVFDVLVPEMESARIKPEEFADLYGEDSMRKDATEVARLEAIFYENDMTDPSKRLGNERGKLFEAILTHLADKWGWIAPFTKAVVPSRYDDIINKVDLIVRMEKPAIAHLALAMDVTEDEKSVTKKLNEIRESIDREGDPREKPLTGIKYFKSANYRGELNNIPRVIVGSEGKAVAGLVEKMDRYMSLKTEQKNGGISANSKELKKLEILIKKSPVRLNTLFEIKAQLEAFARYSKENHKSISLAAYEKALALITESINNSIRPEKQEAAFKKVSEDRVASVLFDKLKTFGKIEVAKIS